MADFAAYNMLQSVKRTEEQYPEFMKNKKANENIKTERNNLIKKNNLLSEGKNKLLKQNEELKVEIIRLKEELLINKANIDNSIQFASNSYRYSDNHVRRVTKAAAWVENRLKCYSVIVSYIRIQEIY